MQSYTKCLSYPLRATYGRSPKKPTVGRHHDLPWVGKATHSRFFSASSVDALRDPSQSLFVSDFARGRKFADREAKKERFFGEFFSGSEALLGALLRGPSGG